jgi:ElaB/YqjD/DUF883 family membrane-anchored ribosome-binding protein
MTKNEDPGLGAGDSASEVETATGEGRGRFRDAVHKTGERARAVAEKARDQVHHLREKNIGDIANDVGGVVKRHPGQAVLISALVGFALGALLGRRR